MMMETVVYSREFLFVKQLYESGELGRIQFLRGAHQQEMAGWPGYWEGLPPMHYATHCVSPCLALAGQARRERRLPRLGPDQRRADREVRLAVRRRDAPRSSCATRDLAAEVTRSLFETARQYIESFDVYGDKVTFEWPQIEHEPAVLHRGEKPGAGRGARLRPPAARGDPPLHHQGRLRRRRTQHLSFMQGSGHGGSHPHLAHEFVTRIVEDRQPLPDAATAPTGRWPASAPTSRR